MFGRQWAAMRVKKWRGKGGGGGVEWKQDNQARNNRGLYRGFLNITTTTTTPPTTASTRSTTTSTSPTTTTKHQQDRQNDNSAQLQAPRAERMGEGNISENRQNILDFVLSAAKENSSVD